MSSAPEDEQDLLAAEHSLGLLDGPDRAEAERLLATDADFAIAVAQWNERFAPLFDEVAPVAPPPGAWDRVNNALDEEGGRSSNVHSLTRRLTAWRTYSAAISAVAAALLVVVAVDTFQPEAERPPQQQPNGQTLPVMVANVVAEDRSAAYVVSYDPSGRSLLVSPAVATPDPSRDRQLWLIPASGTPQSLGLLASSEPHRLPVPRGLENSFRRDATIAISVEPIGGSPTGQPTGPVIATGTLAEI